MDEDLARYRSEYHGHLYHLSRAGGSIADWTVERVLGRGGFGAVAKVRDPSGGLGALKLAHPTVCDKEADILRSFGGNTIPILLADPVVLSEVDFPTACYVMELADLTLAQYFNGDGTRPAPETMWCSLATDSHYRRVYDWLSYERREWEALAVAGAVLVALGKVRPHRHLDLCPSNVLLFGSEPTTWTPKVADWGNERIYEDGGETSYTLIGGKELWCPPRTRAYALHRAGASPEPPTDKTDMYGLGALLCWMLTGTVPDQLARWDVRDDPDSGDGLPLDRIDRAWHELLVGTTRADRRARIDRDEAMELLATNRPIIRRREEIEEITSALPVEPVPVVGDQHAAAPPVLPTPPTPPARRVRRSSAFGVLAVAVVVALSVAVPLYVGRLDTTSPGDDQPTDTSSPAPCAQTDLWCESALLDHLAGATATTAKGRLEADVRTWHRGSVQRQELVNNEWVGQTYDDVAVLRLNFRNLTATQQQVAVDRLGLVVALAAGTSVPAGLVPISAPAGDLDDPVLAWAPALPLPFVGGSHLISASTVPSGTSIGDEFPHTVLFDLSAAGAAKIVGLGGGAVNTPAGATAQATVDSLRPALDWPAREESLDGLYDDLGDGTESSQDSTGTCFVALFDVGAWYRGVDCDLPHHGEVVGTTQVPVNGEGGYNQSEADAACSQTYGWETGIDPNVSFTISAIPTAQPVQDGYDVVHCIAVPGADAPSLWVGPQSTAARP